MKMLFGRRSPTHEPGNQSIQAAAAEEMSQTAFVIGISTPTRSDSDRKTGAVVRPSTFTSA